VRDGQAFALLVLDVAPDGRVRRLYAISNPDKLQSLRLEHRAVK
jgi:hypothetical protein